MPSYSGSKLLGVDVSVVDTTAAHELGDTFTDQQGRSYVYVQDSGSGVALGDSVKLIAGKKVTTCANNDAIYGVAQVAIGANQYGWVQVRGEVSAKINTSVAANILLGLLALTGAKLQAVPAVNEGGATVYVAGVHTVRAKSLTAESGGFATVYLYAH